MTNEQTGQVFGGDTPMRWSQFARMGEAWLAQAGLRSGPVACVVDDALQALAVAAAAHDHALDVAILGRERLTPEVERVLLEAGLSISGRPGQPEAPSPSVPGRVWILTSGTTGIPKLVQHSWDTLLTAPDRLEAHRWLLTYQPGTYAWYQLVVPSLRISRQDLVVAPYGDVHAAIRSAAIHGANAISSTPTFWRVAFMSADPADLERLSPRQVTLGGELVDQAILDLLRRTFPAARITHIYAASEVGACIVVHDGRAGFPAALVAGHNPDSRLRIDDGRLWVRPRRQLAGQPPGEAGWIDTGDIVEATGDRVYFRGRVGRPFVSVGGQKAFPADVEGVLLGHSAVRWCRVEARRAPVVGYLLAAKVVAVAPGDPAVLEQQLSAYCRDRLPEYAVPRFFQFLGEIPVGANLKSML